jgi:hypothetical protein
MNQLVPFHSDEQERPRLSIGCAGIQRYGSRWVSFEPPSPLAQRWQNPALSLRHSAHWKDQIVPQDESTSEGCLHCEINDLVQEYIEGQEKVDIVELAAKMAESLVELVLLAPEEEQAKLLAGQEAAWLISGGATGHGRWSGAHQ